MAKKSVKKDDKDAGAAAAAKPNDFKIGDRSRRGMSAPAQVQSAKKKEADEASPESTSMGFARIEAILEKEDPVLIGESLNKILSDLNALHEGAGTNKDKLAAKKAMAAVERAVDLMDYLYQTKQALEDQAKAR